MDKGILLEVKASIRSLVVSSNCSITIQDLEKDFKTFMGSSLPYTQLGFHNAEQFLRTLPDVVRITGYGPQALLHYVPNKKSEHIADLVKNQKSTTNRRRKRFVKERGRRSYPIYISMSEESPEELANFGQLNINDLKKSPQKNENCSPYTFNTNESANKTSNCTAPKQHHTLHEPRQPNVTEKCLKDESTASQSSLATTPQKGRILSKRFNIILSEEHGDNIANNSSKKSLNSTLPIESTTKSNANIVRFGSRCFPIEEMHNTSSDAVPEDAMTDIIENLGNNQPKIIGEPILPQRLQIPQCKLYEELKIGSVISLYISEVISPMIFFFHVDEEDHELIKLENRMQDIYSLLAFNDLIITNAHLQPGRFCAVNNDNTWYRAKILSVPTHLNDFSKIKLLFIDYGYISEVPVKHIKQLAPMFFSIPIQAVRGRLFQIKSNELVRSAGATNYFTTLVKEHCLYAYVANVEKDTPLLDLILMDTSVQPKCNINEILIKKGFAEKDETTKL